MLMKPTTTQPTTTFARCGRYGVYLVSGMPCPYCARMLHAADAEIDRRGDAWLICAGCHKDIVKIEELP
jgi:hypothetical protein